MRRTLGTPRWGAVRFGLSSHFKALWTTVAKRKRTYTFRRILKSAIYRQDLQDQTACRKRARDFHLKHAAKERVTQALHRRRQQASAASVTAREWVSHVRSTVNRNMVIELPAHVGQLECKHSSEYLCTPAALPAMAAESLEPLPGVPGDKLLIKIVHPHPSTLRLLQPHAAAGSGLASDDLCISVHEPFGELPTESYAMVCSQSRHLLTAGHVLSGLQSSFQELRRVGLIGWSTPGLLSYGFRNAPVPPQHSKETVDVCTSLVVNGACKEEHAMQLAPSQDGWLRTLQFLAAGDLVRQTPSGRWFITNTGLSQLIFGHCYANPVDLTEPRPGSLAWPVEDMTNFELLCYLQCQGWAWKPLPAAKRRAQLDYAVGGTAAKVFYGGVGRASHGAREVRQNPC